MLEDLSTVLTEENRSVLSSLYNTSGLKNPRFDIELNGIFQRINPSFSWCSGHNNYTDIVQFKDVLCLLFDRSYNYKYSRTIKVFMSNFDEDSSNEVLFLNSQYKDNQKLVTIITYNQNYIIDLSEINEFSTELFLQSLIKKHNYTLSLNALKEAMILCYDIYRNRIPIEYIEIGDTSALQEYFLKIYRHLI